MGTTQFMAVPYALNATNVTGLEAINEGNGIGWRLKGQDPDNFGNIGQNSVDLSTNLASNTIKGATGSNATASGYNTVASGEYSTAMGDGTLASNEASTALGKNTISSGRRSTSMGFGTTASGDYSTAMGYQTKALGDDSTAMGNSTEASSHASLAIGRFNLGGGQVANWVATNPLFEVGNGSAVRNKSNALTILKNGNTAVGTHNVAPSADFQVFHGTGNLNGFKLQNKGNNNNWWRFYTLNNNGALYLYSKAGGDNNAVGSFNNVSGAYSAISDRRVKENVNDLHFNWQDFMKLEPLSYQYKSDRNKQSQIGFIAQDVMPIYPELVNYNEEADLYQLNYSGFGVVAVKAIQKLKNEVKALTEENMQIKILLENQEQTNIDQGIVLQTLLARIEALETNN